MSQNDAPRKAELLSVRLTPEGGPARFEAWLDVNRPFAVVSGVQGQDRPELWAYEAHRLQNCVTTFFSNGPIRYVRDRTRVRRSDFEYLVVQLCTMGSHVLVNEGTALPIAAGDILIFDMCTPIAGICDEASADFSIIVPHSAVGYMTGVSTPVLHFPACSPLATLIERTLHRDLQVLQYRDPRRPARSTA